jgi:tRNA 2-selenouridine synthase
VCGLTGSGKTYILRQLKQRGAQVLDLEGIANHRGSLLGEEWIGNLHPNLHKNTLNRYYCNSYKALNLAKLYG